MAAHRGLDILPGLTETLVSRSSLLLFASAVFLGSFLMFLLEPMIAKTLLPRVGGAPMVWNTCVLFFQLILLFGYAYAHGLSRVLGERVYSLVYVALVLLGFVALPLAVDLSWQLPAAGSPLMWLLRILSRSVGLPFFVLAVSASTLQVWFHTSGNHAAADPYFLFAASNFGSLMALLLYPAVFEPLLSLGSQRALWTALYVIFAVLAGVSTFVGRPRSRRQRSVSVNLASDRRPVALLHRFRWSFLAFIPSSLLLGVTSYLSSDIVGVPLLWIVPLAIYLVTFVAAFGGKADSCRVVAARRLPLFVAGLVVFMTPAIGSSPWVLAPLHLTVFGLAALMCHSQLADERPGAGHLTEFYFWVAVGGAFGGVFNTLVAPRIFPIVWEYPVLIVVACAARGLALSKDVDRLNFADLLVPGLIGALTAAGILLVEHIEGIGRATIVSLALPAILSFSQARRPLRFALAIGSILSIAGITANGYGRVLERHRTFFGVYRVSKDQTGNFFVLYHGTTIHGSEATDPTRRHEPLMYYHWTGPFGQAFDSLPQLAATSEVAVVGLGVGSLATYARPGQRWTFYEIDPAVERIARDSRYFTYLGDCGDRCQVVIGDARVSLSGAKPNEYGLIVLDAFSSDAIPIHLLTREALSLYLSRLLPTGVLAFHISNRHLALRPILARLVSSLNATGVAQFHTVPPSVEDRGISASEWVLVSQDADAFEPLLHETGWSRLIASPAVPLWTDDFSNILTVMRLW